MTQLLPAQSANKTACPTPSAGPHQPQPTNGSQAVSTSLSLGQQATPIPARGTQETPSVYGTIRLIRHILFRMGRIMTVLASIHRVGIWLCIRLTRIMWEEGIIV